ncbi:DUF349 domain-containing protein [Georgenia sp. AZ-5]|uniref:DUF349 domain-containing protein n=1 Tax=Georgenia sp. AZ-5 TaxID=3367526 RepID=UPI0037542C4E
MTEQSSPSDIRDDRADQPTEGAEADVVPAAGAVGRPEAVTDPAEPGTEAIQPPAGDAVQPPVDDAVQPPVDDAVRPPVDDAVRPPAGGATQTPVDTSAEEPVEAATQPQLENAEPAADAAPSPTPAPAAEAPAAAPDAPAAAPEAPAAPAPTDAATPSPAAPETAAPETAPETAAPETAPAPRPTPRAFARPAGRPRVPAAPEVAAPVTPPVDPHDAAEAAAWGRVDDDGTVWVREATGERVVGQYTGADREEALGFYVRRFLDLQAQVALFEARLPQLSAKEIDQTMATLTEALAEPTAVGDLDALRTRLDQLRAVAEQRREQAAAEREAARAQALAARTAIVEKAEKIAAQDPAKTQWKQSGERLRELLDSWKSAQRSGPRLDRPTEDALWKRFSHARTAFDRHRRQYFSELDAAQAQVKAAKELLIARAEELSSSTDWGRTAAAYRELMDEWKAAGRAARKDDDALWARFRAAQQRFFDARSEQNAQVDAEFAENLKVKLELLEQAEALLPVTDVRAARAALRPIQDRWDEAGKVPRSEVQRVEGRMRAVEQAVRDAEQAMWQRTDPEKKARAEGAAAQLEAAISALESELEQARGTGDARQIAEAEAALQARRAWLDQVQRTAQD